MILKFIKKKQILFLILFLLLSIALITLSKKTEIIDEPSKIKTELKEDNTTHPKKATVTQETIKPKKKALGPQKNLITITPLAKKINFIGKDKLLIDMNPSLNIEQIMQEQEKIDFFVDKEYSTEKKKDWIIDYQIGLEENAMEELKTDPSLKLKMINGKVGFSTSF